MSLQVSANGTGRRTGTLPTGMPKAFSDYNEEAASNRVFRSPAMVTLRLSVSLSEVSKSLRYVCDPNPSAAVTPSGLARARGP